MTTVSSSEKSIAPQEMGGTASELVEAPPVAVVEPQDDVIRETTITTTVTRERDKKGRYLPKRPLEFTWPHFWLEVTEVALAILIAQALWETGVWLIK